MHGPQSDLASPHGNITDKSDDTPQKMPTLTLNELVNLHEARPHHDFPEQGFSSDVLSSIAPQSDTHSELTKPSLPDKQHNRPPRTSYPVDITSTCEENQSHVPKGLPHQRDQHKQVDEIKRLQRTLKHGQRRKKTSSEPRSRLKEDSLKRSPRRRHRRKDHCHGPLLHQRSRLHLRSKQLRHHHIKRPKRHETTPCTLQGERQRPISLNQRARKLHARRVYHLQRRIRRYKIPAVDPAMSSNLVHCSLECQLCHHQCQRSRHMLMLSRAQQPASPTRALLDIPRLLASPVNLFVLVLRNSLVTQNYSAF